jgi:hypothetical protein
MHCTSGEHFQPHVKNGFLAVEADEAVKNPFLFVEPELESLTRVCGPLGVSSCGSRGVFGTESLRTARTVGVLRTGWPCALHGPGFRDQNTVTLKIQKKTSNFRPSEFSARGSAQRPRCRIFLGEEAAKRLNGSRMTLALTVEGELRPILWMGRV